MRFFLVSDRIHSLFSLFFEIFFVIYYIFLSTYTYYHNHISSFGQLVSVLFTTLGIHTLIKFRDVLLPPSGDVIVVYIYIKSSTLSTLPFCKDGNSYSLPAVSKWDLFVKKIPQMYLTKSIANSAAQVKNLQIKFCHD